MELGCYEKISSGADLNVKEIQKAIKTLKNILKKGGVVVVSENDTLITTYKLDSYDRRLAFK
ncbi:6-phosphofructokinase [Psychrobacter sp. ANT_WB68]|jgi:ubiquinone/menaquinone biosynthesis C-methylase UbiE|uniref:6-phosphofructokinase n=1 Tax=Psychrobacter sp. ANT_WB68 TaxID=2597355 RepID=UPI0011F3E68D|nr:6-phosphofructokinase [Psychrobacter sp. ANT_WB68]KAA0913101.1 hypothetical protein FQ084_11460 [Psychrobacter sp. ANT_WB68]